MLTNKEVTMAIETCLIRREYLNFSTTVIIKTDPIFRTFRVMPSSGNVKLENDDKLSNWYAVYMSHHVNIQRFHLNIFYAHFLILLYRINLVIVGRKSLALEVIF